MSQTSNAKGSCCCTGDSNKECSITAQGFVLPKPEPELVNPTSDLKNLLQAQLLLKPYPDLVQKIDLLITNIKTNNEIKNINFRP